MILYDAYNSYAVKTDSKLRDTYNLIRLISFPDCNANINTKTNAKSDTKLTDFPHNQLLYDVDIPASNNYYYLRMILTPDALNAREYEYFAYKLDP